MMLKRVLVTGISAQFADCEGIVRVIIVEATVADRVLCLHRCSRRDGGRGFAPIGSGQAPGTG